MLAVLVYLTSLRLSFIFHGLDFALIRPAIRNAGLAIEKGFFKQDHHIHITVLLCFGNNDIDCLALFFLPVAFF